MPPSPTGRAPAESSTTTGTPNRTPASSIAAIPLGAGAKTQVHDQVRPPPTWKALRLLPPVAGSSLMRWPMKSTPYNDSDSQSVRWRKSMDMPEEVRRRLAEFVAAFGKHMAEHNRLRAESMRQ